MYYASRQPEDRLTAHELGARYEDMAPEDRSFCDFVISRTSNGKIPAIKFLRSKLSLSLSEAKELYEAREVWINQPASPYGFTSR